MIQRVWAALAQGIDSWVSSADRQRQAADHDDCCFRLLERQDEAPEIDHAPLPRRASS